MWGLIAVYKMGDWFLLESVDPSLPSAVHSFTTTNDIQMGTRPWKSRYYDTSTPRLSVAHLLFSSSSSGNPERVVANDSRSPDPSLKVSASKKPAPSEAKLVQRNSPEKRYANDCKKHRGWNWKTVTPKHSKRGRTVCIPDRRPSAQLRNANKNGHHNERGLRHNDGMTVSRVSKASNPWDKIDMLDLQ
jgi:hypothetical protein